MPAWYMPMFKTIAPHIGTIISAAAPIFTKKGGDSAANNSAANQAVVQKQITELQIATSANNVHIKELAEQTRHILMALEEDASFTERRHQRILFLCVVATVLSVTALCSVVYILLAANRH